jgi:hypothetical protein
VGSTEKERIQKLNNLGVVVRARMWQCECLHADARRWTSDGGAIAVVELWGRAARVEREDGWKAAGETDAKGSLDGRIVDAAIETVLDGRARMCAMALGHL